MAGRGILLVHEARASSSNDSVGGALQLLSTAEGLSEGLMSTVLRLSTPLYLLVGPHTAVVDRRCVLVLLKFFV